MKFFFRKCLIFKDFPKGCEILGVLLSSSIFSFFIKEAKYIEEEYAFYNTRLKFKGVDLPKYSFFHNFFVFKFHRLRGSNFTGITHPTGEFHIPFLSMAFPVIFLQGISHLFHTNQPFKIEVFQKLVILLYIPTCSGEISSYHHGVGHKHSHTVKISEVLFSTTAQP